MRWLTNLGIYLLGGIGLAFLPASLRAQVIEQMKAVCK